VRGATSRANSYQANPGAGIIGSILGAGVAAAIVTVVAGMLF